MTEQNKKLFNEFQSFTESDWLELIQKDFPGKSIDDLSWNSPEGIAVKPIFTNEDHINKPPVFENRDWSIQQSFNNLEISEVNRLAKLSLANECTDLGFDFNYQSDGITGINIQTDADFIKLFNSIDLKTCHFHFSGIGIHQTIFTYLKSLATDKKIKAEQISGTVQFDPYRELLTTDQVTFPADQNIDALADFLRSGTEFTQMKKLVISSSHFKSAAADCISEMTYTLSTLIDYLAGLTDRGFTIDELNEELSFRLAIGSNFFFEIAKLRAFRILVKQILNDYGLKSDPQIDICAITSDWNKSTMDSHTNLLRTTTEAMSAAIGGANRIEVSPFDENDAESNEFSLRLARNIQNLLKSESHLNIVADSAAGSYYIESITDQFIQKTWANINVINDMGGFYKQIKSGQIQKELKSKQEKIFQLLQDKKAIQLGVNEFINEKVVQQKKTGRVQSFTKQKVDNLNFNTHSIQLLNQDRAALQFEKGLK